ncbi:hypothetical protein BB558_003294 [Smittium angustum]|uniref:Uncharacterized protein n=1 Tax=Smittium angustum TaxID=133377 RepID=A0A2U1J6K8_SMIAN|nr:hypothetical protein BB558_003294 [Smittium angustum]
MLFKQSLVLLATAVTLAVSQSAQSITGYLPAGLKGNALMVTQGKYPVPNFRELTQSSDYNPLLYTPDNITETGWTLDSLSFLKTMNFDPTNLLCLNGDISSVCTNVPDLDQQDQQTAPQAAKLEPVPQAAKLQAVPQAAKLQAVPQAAKLQAVPQALKLQPAPQPQPPQLQELQLAPQPQPPQAQELQATPQAPQAQVHQEATKSSQFKEIFIYQRFF